MSSSEINRPSREAVAAVSKATGLSRIVAKMLVARGIDTPQAAQAFLTPSLERDWHDPNGITNLPAAADKIEAAIRANKRITIFGDYDLDGISSTALLTLGLRALDAQVEPLVPLRFGEGYGLTKPAIERILSTKPDLLITVDCGVANAAEVATIVDRGVDVVITDHHERSGEVPQGVPVVDPRLDEDCPSRDLAGAGVALKMVQALFERFDRGEQWTQYSDLAMLGTVADLVPLTGENRALVAHGMKQMIERPRPGILSLSEMAGASPAELTSSGLSFTLIPRFNAAGRMGDPKPALDLLLTNDPIKARAYADVLEECNKERKFVERELTKVAVEQARALDPADRVIVVAGEGWHEGIRGIVATQLSGKFALPSFVLSINGEVAQGSGRSVGKLDLFAAIETVSDLFLQYGGHKGAVGITLKTRDLPEFRRRLSEYFKACDPSEFVSTLQADVTAHLSDITFELIEELDRLRPFGQANPTPLFELDNVFIKNCIRLGPEKNHLRFLAYDGAAELPAIAFRCKNIEGVCETDSAVNLMVEPTLDTWNGRNRLQLLVREIQTDLGQECDVPAGALAEELLEASRGAAKKTSTAADMREHLRSLDSQELEREIVKAFLGESELHGAQRDALRSLAAGESPLVVMATGRGKSCIFHVHAAKRAIKDDKASVFVFPLRALVSDQRHHLQESFGRLGLSVEILNGETSHEDRYELFERLDKGKIDVILTTPEFLSIHRDRFAQSGRIGFLVVDEAHHVALANSYDRPMYRDLTEVRAALGDPTVAAFTATASKEIAAGINEVLGITNQILDKSKRENLRLIDKRNIRDKENYLVARIAQSQGSKSIIYVNSRAEAVVLTRMIRKRVAAVAPYTAFYHGGLSRDIRAQIETAFRSGAVELVVATSAFGEGVNIGDISDIYLYHMPFGAVAFNQMSGRAGRDGDPATIHLLFGHGDASINDRILASNEIPQDDGSRYLEIMHEREEFGRFRDWVMKTPAAALRETIINPILPE